MSEARACIMYWTRSRMTGRSSSGWTFKSWTRPCFAGGFKRGPERELKGRKGIVG